MTSEIEAKVDALKKYVEREFEHLREELGSVTTVVKEHERILKGNGKKGLVTKIDLQDQSLEFTQELMEKIDKKTTRVEWYFAGAVILIVVERLLTG